MRKQRPAIFSLCPLTVVSRAFLPDRYSSTKFALEGFSEALALEIAQFGIKLIIVEPGAFRRGS
jgi:NAD(P)-dependent dehydrogenase (short-subunit alcohol dehydrogenase family)